MKFCDLHLHTTYSDSTHTPGELVEQASKAGIGVIAVADHDTVSGIKPVTEAAKTYDIEVIPAIELTAEYDGLEIHILGYFIEFEDEAFLRQLEVLKKRRVERIYKIAEKLKDMGISIDTDDVFALSHNKGSVGRPHIARVLVKSGYCRTMGEAFEKYIGDNCPAYVCGFRFSPQEAIRLIRATAGVSVLAHPYTLHDDNLIPLLVKAGIQGLEVYYPEHSASMTERYKNLAQHYGLLITGGSDCHGDARPDVKIGSIKIPYELVETLKAVKEKLK